MSKFVFLPLALLIGCGAPVMPGHGVSPSTVQETLVAKFIVETANEPGSVEFVKWGPHLEGEGIYRVALRQKQAGNMMFQDYLYRIKDGKASKMVLPNVFGDDWINKRFKFEIPKLPKSDSPNPAN